MVIPTTEDIVRDGIDALLSNLDGNVVDAVNTNPSGSICGLEEITDSEVSITDISADITTS